MPTRVQGEMTILAEPVLREIWVDEGFAAFVRDRSAQLARTAFLLTADRHLAEDLVQTALAKVADRWTRIAGQGDPTPYVRKVMLHTAISWRRRRSSGETPVASMPDSPDSTAAIIDEDERLRRAPHAGPPPPPPPPSPRVFGNPRDAATAPRLRRSGGTVQSPTSNRP